MTQRKDRLAGMTDSNNNTIVSGVSYDAASRLLGMTYANVEIRGYNVLGQLTSLYNSGGVNLTYNYPSGTNIGKVSSTYNATSGETVTYTYDSLNRIATAAGSGWGEAYGFDPFGNLLSKTVTAGSGPSLSQTVNPSNNQNGATDANGNSLYTNNATPLYYDVENRVSALGWNNGVPTLDYSYDAQNRRIFVWTPGTVDSFNNTYNYAVVAYSPSGQKLATYQFAPQQPFFQGNINTPYMIVSLVASDQYFGGRRLAPMDQLGSAGTYYPWGEAKGTTNPQDTWSYATYWRDSATGLDYANNRYYSNVYGRFMTPDPYHGSGSPSDPQTWNRYTYAGGDPVNRIDPTGKDFFSPIDPGACGASADSDFFDCNGGDFCEGFQDGDASSQSPEAGCGPPSGPCVGVDGFTPSPSPYCQDFAPAPAPAPAPPPPQPKCPPEFQAWITAHGADALAAGLPEANTLALSAIESGWGTGRFAAQGNDFFNLETCWAFGTPQPAPKYAYQVGWLQAGSPSNSCGRGLHYALVATYASSLNSFKSVAATFANLNVTDPTTFAANAVADGINAGKDPNFLQMQQTFVNCLTGQ